MNETLTSNGTTRAGDVEPAATVRGVVDPLTGHRVISATATQARPRLPDRTGCRFCPGHPAEPGVETARIPGRADDAWLARSWVTPFPVTDWHEVICFTPDHDGALATLSEEHLAAFAEIVTIRTQACLASGAAVAYLQLNAGPKSYASVAHPHAQLIGFADLPAALVDEQARLTGERCALCSLSDRVDEKYLVAATDAYSVWCPPWARRAYELLVVPAAGHDPAESLAATLAGSRAAAHALAARFPHGSHNVSVHQLGRGFHTHAHIHLDLADHVDPTGYGGGHYVNRHDPAENAYMLRTGSSTEA